MMTHKKLENQPSQKLRETDRNNKKNLISGSIIATLVAITPYIFYLYESVPDDKIWDTFLFTFESLYYENANVAVWIMMGKIIPLYLTYSGL